MDLSSSQKLNKSVLERLLQNPFFYFGSISFVLLGLLCFWSPGLAQIAYGNQKAISSKSGDSSEGDPFFTQKQAAGLESPDLKISQGSFIAAISTPRVLTPQVLGTIFGGEEPSRREVIEYAVQSGDTVESVSKSFNVSFNTLLWANDLSKNSKLKAGQLLTILPVSGVVHVVRSGNTVSELATIYQTKAEDIIAFNDLTGEGDIFIGDVIIVPDGVMPAKKLPYSGQTSLAQNSWIYPLLKFKMTQGLHFFNGVDLASLDGCGSPVYAVASGVVQRAVGNGKWNIGMGNHVTILHANGVATYYGHLSAVLVKPGDSVTVGDRIGSEGKTGHSTGCHVHFQVVGAGNYIASKVQLGQIVDVTK